MRGSPIGPMFGDNINCPILVVYLSIVWWLGNNVMTMIRHVNARARKRVGLWQERGFWTIGKKIKPTLSWWSICRLHDRAGNHRSDDIPLPALIHSALCSNRCVVANADQYLLGKTTKHCRMCVGRDRRALTPAHTALRPSMRGLYRSNGCTAAFEPNFLNGRFDHNTTVDAVFKRSTLIYSWIWLILGLGYL